ncbi:MAG: hypothetical protein MN733_01505 [Nitrososphaera sp.]|nr:hypothetical protein [Nitrososphaera sp.]
MYLKSISWPTVLVAVIAILTLLAGIKVARQVQEYMLRRTEVLECLTDPQCERTLENGYPIIYNPPSTYDV